MQVRHALRRGGFLRHVSGFTLHAVLEACADTAPGLAGDALLPSLPVILDVFLEELVGEIANEKVCDPNNKY